MCQIKHPSYIQLDYQQVLLNTNSAFMLQARASLVTLKGQMLPTTLSPPGARPACCKRRSSSSASSSCRDLELLPVKAWFGAAGGIRCCKQQQPPPLLLLLPATHACMHPPPRTRRPAPRLCPALVPAGSPPGSPPLPVLVFLASPRMRDLAEMQGSRVFLSDIPTHDMTADYILLAEQRHAEADLKEKYERLTVELKVRTRGRECTGGRACGSRGVCVRIAGATARVLQRRCCQRRCCCMGCQELASACAVAARRQLIADCCADDTAPPSPLLPPPLP